MCKVAVCLLLTFNSLTTIFASAIGRQDDLLSKYRPYADENGTEECLQLMANTDTCVGRALFLSQDERALPSSLDDINNYCSELRSTVECVNNYKKCLQLFSKTFFGMIVRDVKKTMNKICSSGEEKKTVLQHLKCFDETKLPILHSTMTSWTHLLAYLSSNVQPDELIPNLCCSLHVIEDDGLSVINDQCSQVTKLDTGRFVVDLIRSSVEDAVDIGCGKFNNMAVCEKELGPQVKNYTQMIVQGRSEAFQVTPIVPLLQIAKRLDEQMYSESLPSVSDATVRSQV